MIALDPGWLWLGGAAVLATAEIVAPGFFLIWVAAAAAFAGLATALVGLALPAELAVFAIAAVVAVIAARRLDDGQSPSADPLLNERAVRLIGTRVVVEDAIVGGFGRVRIADGFWRASGPDAPAGTIMEVIGVDGGTVRVSRPALASRSNSA